MTSVIIKMLKAAGWIAYFSLLGFIVGIFIGVTLIGNQREESGYRKAKQELLNNKSHGRN